jgi:hypothetical protein
MAEANSLATLNHAPNPEPAPQRSTRKLRPIRIKPADRRYFIGGSDARVILGTRLRWAGSGARSAANSSQRTFPAISSSSLG